jgi:transcriptional regulator with XRE-family HTH domain
MDVLPKNRTLAIRGDVVRSLRIQKKWGTTEDFAEAIRMSKDRMEAIERGGAKVFAGTLVRLAEALDVHWRELLCEPEAANHAPAPVIRKGGQAATLYIAGKTLADLTEEDIAKYLAKLRELTGIQGEIQLISLEEGSIVFTLGLDDDDAARTVAAFCAAKLDSLDIAEMRLPGDRAIWEKLQQRYGEAERMAQMLGKKAVALGEAFDDATITRICSEYEVENNLPNVLCSTVEAKVRTAAHILYEALSRRDGGFTFDIDDSGSLNLRRTRPLATSTV